MNIEDCKAPISEAIRQVTKLKKNQRTKNMRSDRMNSPYRHVCGCTKGIIPSGFELQERQSKPIYRSKMPATLQRTHGLAVITAQQYEQAKDRYMHGESAETIAKDLGCKRCVLDTRFSREGLPKKRLERLKDGRGERTKHKYAQISEEIADRLVGNAPKSLENLEKHAEVALKGGKLGAIVHGWGEGVNLAIVLPGVLTGTAQEEQEPIDIETATERQQLPESTTEGQ